jgi:hypothetical protein
MSIPMTPGLCDCHCVNTARQYWWKWLVTLMATAVGFNLAAQSTNSPAGSNTPPARVKQAPTGIGESTFSIIAERNIFNANRSGGQVRLESRRPAQIESFTLVGTMAYEKGTFAFFEGSSSEFTKAIKADSVIAGHKLVDIYANSVKLEADGKDIELPIGSQMRREDAGLWKVAVAEARGSGGNASGNSSRRSSRSDRGGVSSPARGTNSESASPSSPNTSSSSADQAEVLKRLMERREKESQ